MRGKLWDLHRRTVDENSAIFRQYDELVKTNNTEEIRNPHLFSIFLSDRERVNMQSKSLGFSVDLRVLVPQYEVDGFLMFKNHYEGGYLFNENINLEAHQSDARHATWWLKCGFDSTRVDPARGDMWVFRIPIEQKTRPGIVATLELTASVWNEGEPLPPLSENAGVVSDGGPGTSVLKTEEEVVFG